MKVICDYCGHESSLVDGSILYPHLPLLKKRNFWYCKPCCAWVGCHLRNPKHTLSGYEPLGRLAKKDLRDAKVKAHKHIDSFWQSGKLTRSEVYKRLAAFLNVDKEKCHIGLFDIFICRRVLKFNGEIHE